MLQVDMKLIDPRLEGIMDYATVHSAGLDLRATAFQHIGTTERTKLEGDKPFYVLYPGEKILIGTGIALHLASLIYRNAAGAEEAMLIEDSNETVAAMLLPRSGLGTKIGIRLANTVGLVDADYQGEILLAIEHGGEEPFVIKALDRLAQMVIVPVLRPTFKVVEEFGTTTARGAGGFGSTGIG